MLHVKPGTYEAAQRPDCQFRMLHPIPRDVWEGASKGGGFYQEVDTTDIQIDMPTHKKH
tara:strand:+ start:317 stop:493 length:177 start_codon:yes stop_codon:yes gene_type:complete